MKDNYPEHNQPHIKRIPVPKLLIELIHKLNPKGKKPMSFEEWKTFRDKVIKEHKEKNG